MIVAIRQDRDSCNRQDLVKLHVVTFEKEEIEKKIEEEVVTIEKEEISKKPKRSCRLQQKACLI